MELDTVSIIKIKSANEAEGLVPNIEVRRATSPAEGDGKENRGQEERLEISLT